MSLARFLIPFLLATVWLHAAEKSPAHRLLDAADFQSNSMSTSKAVFKAVFDVFKIEGLPAQALAEISAEADRAFAKTVQDPEYQLAVAKLYDQKFTPEEIEEMIRFYETPVGRKLVKAMAEVSEEEEKIGQQFFEKNAPDFQNKIDGIVTKLFVEADPEEAEKPDGKEDSKDDK